ncbi:MAG: hypothetical protein ACREE6_03305 [Limisphaerales bacterium]
MGGVAAAPFLVTSLGLRRSEQGKLPGPARVDLLQRCTAPWCSTQGSQQAVAAVTEVAVMVAVVAVVAAALLV